MNRVEGREGRMRVCRSREPGERGNLGSRYELGGRKEEEGLCSGP